MAVDTLKRLSGPTALTTGAVTQYTAPASTVSTLLNIHVTNETSTAATFILSIGTDAAGKRFFYNVSVGPNDFFDWSGTLAIAAGEVIQAYASTGAALTLVITGVETA